MATKKKTAPVEQPASDELQKTLNHFGENSAECRFALMKIGPTKIIHVPADVSKERIDNLLSARVGN